MAGHEDAAELAQRAVFEDSKAYFGNRPKRSAKIVAILHALIEVANFPDARTIRLQGDTLCGSRGVESVAVD